MRIRRGVSLIALAAMRVVVGGEVARELFHKKSFAPRRSEGSEGAMNAEELNFAALSIWRGFRNGTFYGGRAPNPLLNKG